MPHTVPNRPMKGAVEPTEARMARPDCMRAVNSSMQLRRQRVTQSLTSRVSCRCALVLRWWAVASRPSRARGRKGVGGVVEVEDVEGVDEDDDPGCQGHAQQNDRDCARDKVALDPYVGDAELR